MNNKSALIATIVVAVLAVIAVIFTAHKLSSAKSDNPTNPDASGTEENLDNSENSELFVSEELYDEIWDAVQRLGVDNYKLLNLYYNVNLIEGINHEAGPYGKPYSDGYYNFISKDFNSVEEIYALVDKTLSEEEARKLKDDPFGIGPVYIERDGGKIGVNAKIKPFTYDAPAGDLNLSFDILSETSCVLNASFEVTREDGSVDEITKSRGMEKGEDGVWRLESLMF